MQAEGSPHYRPILVNISVIGIHKGGGGARDIALDATIRAAVPDATRILP